MNELLHKALFSVKEVDAVNTIKARLLLAICYFIILVDIPLLVAFYTTDFMREVSTTDVTYLLVGGLVISLVSIALIRFGLIKHAGTFLAAGLIVIITLDDPENIAKTATGSAYLLPIMIVGISNGPKIIMAVTMICEIIVISLASIYGWVENTFDIITISFLVAVIFVYVVKSMDQTLSEIRGKVQLELALQEQRFLSLQAHDRAKFVESIAHDVRGPIKTAQELLIMYDDNDDEEDRIELVETAIGTLGDIHQTITDLLNKNKLSSSEVTNTNIKEAIYSIANDYKKTINISIKAEKEQEYEVRLNTTIFSRAIHNLILNSKEAECRNIHIAIKTSPQSIIVTFRDDGPGYPREILSHGALEGFTTKKNGLGIGLSGMVKNLQSQNIVVDFDNTPGATTTITIPKSRR